MDRDALDFGKGTRTNLSTLPVILVVAVFTSLAASCSAVPAPRHDTPRSGRQSLMHNGMERTYVIRTPAKRGQRAERVPLVLVLHGGGGNAAHAERVTGFTEKAAEEGFIVVYPEGTGRLNDKLLTWNAGHCCGHAMQRRVNDVAFIDALLDELIDTYPVDPRRIYATGMSNGGMMTHRLGIELSNRFAAIAPVVATIFGDEKQPRHPVSAIMINGMIDASVPWQGGPPGGRGANAWDGTPMRPALEQAAFWAGANGCSGDPQKVDRSSSIQWRYGCPAGRGVALYLLKDNGHAWPGGKAGSRRGDQPTSSLNATDVIWEFFEAHTK